MIILNCIKPDSLIFDMDGTLWDATQLYTNAWNICLAAHQIPVTLSASDIAALTGLETQILIERIMPDVSPGTAESVIQNVELKIRELIPLQGGTLYADVVNGLEQLSLHYQLFIVSNCGAQIIRLFMDWAGLNGLITDEIAHGTNFKPKAYNIQLLIDRHNLKNPVYIGDTEGDRMQSGLVTIPFVFMTYGFGKVTESQLEFDDFKTFTNHYLSLVK